MRYIIILFLLILSMYPFSYARYNWNNNNKFSAIGCILLAVMSIVLPSIIIIIR